MRLRTETTFGVGALLALQLLTAFGAIGLLSRVSPAAEKILVDNVYSTEAVEDMLAVLASTQPDADRFAEALARAEGNITEEAEAPLLAAVREQAPGALAGDSAARAQIIADLQALSAVNRDSMRELDEAAQRIGVTGAWAAVLLGSASFFWGALVYRRLRARLERPIQEIDASLQAARSGDNLRRCPPPEGAEELDRIARNINWLLDRVCQPAPPTASLPADGLAQRRLLLTLLDALPVPALLHHPEQGTLAANQAALGPGLPPSDDEGWTILPVPDSPIRLLLWSDPASGGPEE